MSVIEKHEIETQTEEFGVSPLPTSGLPGHANETAVARRGHDHHAQWQGTMSKPVIGWPSRRARNRKEVQTDIEKHEIDTQTEEVDVSLTSGERRARIMQNLTPDEEGFCECNPEEVELCQVESRERRFRLRRGVTADSGAGDSVMPARMVNSSLVRPSAGSKRGLHYVSATDHRIPNIGEVDMNFMTIEEGIEGSIIFQVVDVNKPLMSLSDRVDNGCRLVFDQDDTTGEDLTHLYVKRLKKKMK